ncbi:hypothetical protein P872_20260 [Rhodonellum psychrophilum GCM71 = DSM 17998]|uniref:Glycosyltransferase RgtA/B/C/D-like domain-containing protein n=2 Tax=Rhodonellum TaxID=336827 RepID=U5BZ80_9BACT|nr:MULTISPECIES: hypothetical protein [Rhodonellum]ERM81222.1 hypothetical protein P872_20260 [Rhodonellum psychrophilum GCM71 = DSM 17998]SDZ52266.1 4-amino-4-deoxy-L-arabinose transferase [Rhodonellum ikkaensis]
MPLKLPRQYLSLFVGFLFLSLYFWLGYDGITFSDDVYYLLTGKKFWEGIPISDDYHFSSRFGAYVFSGFFSHLFGLNDHLAALASLFSYLISFYLLWRLSKQNTYQWWFTGFFITHIYFLHFLPKVYPDSLLVLWVIVVPLTAIYRNKSPFWMALAMGLAFIIGFSTKETMVLLLPFPIILFFHDLVHKRPIAFYLWFGIWSVVLLSLYFGFFHWKFGNVFYRLEMVNEGHYISEYTYHDKGMGAIFSRLTYIPFFAFVERAYWPWLVLAIPGLWMAFKSQKPILFEFALTVGCLVLGFWFMTSTLDFYNPIYLNPRHLIVLIGPLSVLIAMGVSDWMSNKIWINWLSILFILGAAIALWLHDFKMSGYLLAFGLAVFFLKTTKQKTVAIAILLLLPVLASIRHQGQIKNYNHFIKAFNETILNNENENLILINNFVYLSKDILLPELEIAKKKLVALENIDRVKTEKPDEFELFVYKYYLHAYPSEQEDIKAFEDWAKTQNYLIVDEKEDQWILSRRYKIN